MHFRFRTWGFRDLELGRSGRVSGTLLFLCFLAPLISGQVDPRPGAPRRIISLIPAVTEMLFAIGAGNEVVGVSSFDRFPPEVKTRPSVGALVDPDFERMLSLKPDLVVVYSTQTDLITRLERAKVSMYRYEHAGLADITTTIRQLGKRVGRVDRATAVAAQIDRDIAEIRRLVAGRARPKTALIFDREPGTLRSLYASAGVGFMHDMLVAAGGDDVFDDVKRQSLHATTEILLARAPEVIIEAHATENWTPERLQRERAVWNALPSLPAVRNGRVYLFADERLSIPGPRVADAIRVLARALHPGAFLIKAPGHTLSSFDLRFAISETDESTRSLVVR
jgi:iron complex transport system substrate-binding protein